MVRVGTAFAPSNIALCKYWGKRDTNLNLPVNSSLSISLGNKGAVTKVSVNNIDQVILNNNLISEQNNFYKKIVSFLNLLRDQNVLTNKKMFFKIDTYSNLPIAAGLASSASGFAALVKALDQLFNWDLSLKQLSILARLGSGSASRSLWNGFVKWHAGIKEDGTDSFAEPIDLVWPELCVGLLVVDNQEKYISSREAMQISVKTSPLYYAWQQLATKDLNTLETSIKIKNFSLFGATAEANALAMHAIMLSSRPAIIYSNSNTISNIKKIWKLRHHDNINLYFTQDAGPNLKLLFLYKDFAIVKEAFPELELIRPFAVEVEKR
ncbi:MAG: diphosphomevalonate decarboxylase [Gammaproteobacteria bacterium]|jgi:diphosphomevalonate decarboxylase